MKTRASERILHLCLGFAFCWLACFLLITIPIHGGVSGEGAFTALLVAIVGGILAASLGDRFWSFFTTWFPRRERRMRE